MPLLFLIFLSLTAPSAFAIDYDCLAKIQDAIKQIHHGETASPLSYQWADQLFKDQPSSHTGIKIWDLTKSLEHPNSLQKPQDGSALTIKIKKEEGNYDVILHLESAKEETGECAAETIVIKTATPEPLSPTHHARKTSVSH